MQLSAGVIDTLVRTTLAERPVGAAARTRGDRDRDRAGRSSRRARPRRVAVAASRGRRHRHRRLRHRLLVSRPVRRYPIDMIKVDRSFVQGAEHDPRDAAISASVVSLAHALGLVAMAEGIESEAAGLAARARLRPRAGLPVRARHAARRARRAARRSGMGVATRGLRARDLPVVPVAPWSSFVGSISELVPAGKHRDAQKRAELLDRDVLQDVGRERSVELAVGLGLALGDGTFASASPLALATRLCASN